MEEQILNPTPTPTPTLTEQEKDKVISTLAKDLEELKRKVQNIQNDKVVENLQLPVEVLASVGIVQESRRLKKGRGSRPMLESEIKEAQEHATTAIGAARYLGISYRSYKKWATRFGMFKINPWGKGDKKKYWEPNKGKYPLNQLLEGKFPNYPIFRLKDLLIRSGTKKPVCEMCGFDGRRVTDNKMPLILNFEDGNEHNHKTENLKLYCYNCTFCYGRGYIRQRKVKFHFGDPDRMQGAQIVVPARF
jgi:hypothetical protein